MAPIPFSGVGETHPSARGELGVEFRSPYADNVNAVSPLRFR